MNRASFAISLAGVFFVFPVFAQEATRPEWKVGDKWSFERTDRTRNVVEHVVESSVANKTDTEYHRRGTNTKTGNATSTINDTNLNTIEFNGRKFTPAIPIYDWPLAVGKKWGAKFEGPNLTRTGQYIEERNCEVVGRESIKVKAGSFDTFKIACKGTFRTPNSSGQVTLNGYT